MMKIECSRQAQVVWQSMIYLVKRFFFVTGMAVALGCTWRDRYMNATLSVI
jgi:hypothetical protein